MRHERKRRKACQIFCAAVAQRYLLVHARITFASGKISPPKGRHGSTSKIQKWKINHISTDTKLDLEERTIERRARKHLGTQPPLRHVPQVQQSHEIGMAERNVRQRRGVSVKTPLLHDNKEDSTYVTDYQDFPFEWYSYDVIGSYCELYKIILPID